MSYRASSAVAVGGVVSGGHASYMCPWEHEQAVKGFRYEMLFKGLFWILHYYYCIGKENKKNCAFGVRNIYSIIIMKSNC